MRTMLFVAVGVWIGKQIYTRLSEAKAKERKLKNRKSIERFMNENLPGQSPEETKKQLNILFAN